MKQFAALALAAFVGVLGALLLYYFAVTRPGVEQEFARLDRVRAEARTVTRELDAAAEGSVARAREGFDDLASTQLRRARLAAALAAASTFKVALAESYMAHGKWPATAAEAGLGEPSSYAADGVRELVLEPGGVVRIGLSESVSPHAVVRLLPTVAPESWQIAWRCEIAGDQELLQLLPQCNLRTGPPDAAITDSEAQGAEAHPAR